jgi:hypothetical protein
MIQPPPRIASIAQVVALLICSALGCTNPTAAVARDKGDAGLHASTALPKVQPFAYSAPTTTPYDIDPISRAQYLKAYHAGWTSLMAGNLMTCCEANEPVTRGYYAGQEAALELSIKDMNSATPDQMDATVNGMTKRLALTRKVARASPGTDWYIPADGNSK